MRTKFTTACTFLVVLAISPAAFAQCSFDGGRGFRGCGITDTHATVDLADAFVAILAKGRFGTIVSVDDVLSNRFDSDDYSPFEYRWGSGPDSHGTWNKYANWLVDHRGEPYSAAQ